MILRARSRFVLVPALLWVIGAGVPALAIDLIGLHAQAREFDPDFQTARYEREISLSAFREARAGVLPQLSASAEASKTYQDIRSSDNFLFVEGRSDFFNQSVGVSLTQPLVRAEEFRRLKQARAEIQQAEYAFASAEQDLMLRLAQALFTYLSARDDLAFASAEREAIRQQLQQTEERLEAGLATITDAHDARARYALARAAEIEAQDALEEGLQGIAEITGERPEDLGVLSDSFPMVPPEREDVQAWVKIALFQNPEIKATEAALEIAEREIPRTRAAFLPTLDLFATYGLRDSGGTVFGEGNEIATTDVGIRLAAPIYDGGRAAARTNAAALRRQIARQSLEREKRRVERETRAAYQGVMSGIGRVQALSDSVFSHQSALAAKEIQSRSGLNTALDVLDARRDLYLARRDLAQARYVYLLNSLRLERAAGSLGIQDLRSINDFLQ